MIADCPSGRREVRRGRPGSGSPDVLRAGWTVWLALVCLALDVASGDTVNTSDGGRVDGSVMAVDTGGVVVLVGRDERRVPLDRVTSVDFGSAARAGLMAQPGMNVIVAEDGSRLGISAVVIADGKVKGRTVLGDTVVPLQALSALICPAAHEKPVDIEALPARLGLKRGEQDALVVSSGGGQAVAVNGILLRMSGGQVVMEYDGAESPLPAESVRMVLMARSPVTTNVATAVASLVCTDGSSVAMESLSVDGGVFAARSPSLGSVRIPRESVAGIRFMNANTVQLSDLVPEARQTGFFDESLPWKKNRAVSGGVLQMNGRTYESGVGVHARCVLTYTLGGAYRSFSALAGIDDSVRAGAAVLSVEADGKVILAPVRLEGGKAPRQVRLDVTGVAKMAIVVDFADGTFGSGARVDLCDGVLAR